MAVIKRIAGNVGARAGHFAKAVGHNTITLPSVVGGAVAGQIKGIGKTLQHSGSGINALGHGRIKEAAGHFARGIGQEAKNALAIPAIVGGAKAFGKNFGNQVHHMGKAFGSNANLRRPRRTNPMMLVHH